MHITDEIKNSNGKSCHSWIVLAKLNPPRYINTLRYINELQYFEGDMAIRKEPEANGRNSNVLFVQIIVPENSSHLIHQDTECIRALLNNARGEELFE